MKPIASLLVTFIVLVGWLSKAEETIILNGHIEAYDSISSTVWIGIFASPVANEAEAWKWTPVDSEEFSLEAPQVEEILLLALLKDHLPVVQRLTPGANGMDVSLEFQVGLTLKGTLRSTDDIPVGNAVLKVERQDLPQVQIPESARSSWTTNDDGQFKISGLSEETYELRFKLPHVSYESFSIRVSERDDRPHELTLSDAYFVLGRVVDQSDVEVEDADVIVQFHSDLVLHATSEESGEFQLGPFIQGRKLRVAAMHEELGLSEHSRVTAGDHDVKLVLAPMVRVLGKVIDASSGEPVDDFQLRAFGNGWNRVYPHVDSDGNISAFVDSKTRVLVVESSEYVTHISVGLTLEPGIEHEMGVVSLDPGRILTGKVSDATTLKPIEFALLSLTRNDAKAVPADVDRFHQTFVELYFDVTGQAITDQNGEYELNQLPLSPFDLEISALDYLKKHVAVDGVTTKLDVQLEIEEPSSTRTRGESETVAGESVEAKGRVEGIIEGLRDRETVTVSIRTHGFAHRTVRGLTNGSFVIEKVGFGEFSVEATSTENRSLRKSFKLNSEQPESYIEFVFAGTSRLYGTMRFPDGSSPSGEIRAIPKQDERMNGWCSIAHDGSYEIFGLDYGEYEVTMYQTSMQEVTIGDSTRGWGRRSPIHQVDVVVSGDTELNVQLPQPSEPD